MACFSSLISIAFCYVFCFEILFFFLVNSGLSFLWGRVPRRAAGYFLGVFFAAGIFDMISIAFG